MVEKSQFALGDTVLVYRFISGHDNYYWLELQMMRKVLVKCSYIVEHHEIENTAEYFWYTVFSISFLFQGESWHTKQYPFHLR